MQAVEVLSDLPGKRKARRDRSGRALCWLRGSHSLRVVGVVSPQSRRPRDRNPNQHPLAGTTPLDSLANFRGTYAMKPAAIILRGDRLFIT